MELDKQIKPTPTETKSETPTETKSETKSKVNPFDAGVSYDNFLEALGKSDIDKYLKGICTEDQIEWLKKDLEIHKNK